MGCITIWVRNLKFPAVVHSCRNNPSDMISDNGGPYFLFLGDQMSANDSGVLISRGKNYIA